MEKYLNMPIKELINKFPRLGGILEEYNIGCVPCTLGSCLLKDIVSIHNLSREQEGELMYRLEKEIYPEREIRKPLLEAVIKKPEPKGSYSPPIKRLVDEHTLIKKWLDFIPGILEGLDLESTFTRQLLKEGINFTRSYADKFHHAKEEEILFHYFDQNLDIIQAMLKDHETGRTHVRAMAEALGKKDKTSMAEHLNGYRELLTEHIKKEDEILYAWMDRNLSLTQVGELFTRFEEAEKLMDKEVIERCKKFVLDLENKAVKVA